MMTSIFTKIKELLLRPLPVPNTEIAPPKDPGDIETQEAIQGLKQKFGLPLPNSTCPTNKTVPAQSSDPVILHVPMRVYVDAMDKNRLVRELGAAKRRVFDLQKEIDRINSA